VAEMSNLCDHDKITQSHSNGRCLSFPLSLSLLNICCSISVPRLISSSLSLCNRAQPINSRSEDTRTGTCGQAEAASDKQTCGEYRLCIYLYLVRLGIQVWADDITWRASGLPQNGLDGGGGWRRGQGAELIQFPRSRIVHQRNRRRPATPLSLEAHARQALAPNPMLTC
jgi:hypothetical protein